MSYHQNVNSALRLPARLPPRRFVAARAPKLASAGVQKQRVGVSLLLGLVGIGLFCLFAWSYYQDISEIAQGTGPTQTFSDTRF